VESNFLVQVSYSDKEVRTWHTIRKSRHKSTTTPIYF